MIFVIIAFAGILGWWMSFERIPQMIAEGVLGLSDNRYMVIAIIIGLLLAVGMVMDITAILIILAPVLVPLTEQVGLAPIHAGIIFVLALNISLMTPPVGGVPVRAVLGHRGKAGTHLDQAVPVPDRRSDCPVRLCLLGGRGPVAAAPAGICLTTKNRKQGGDL